MAPGVKAPERLMVGMSDPVSSKVTTSPSLYLDEAEPFNQLDAVVFQAFAVPSPCQIRFAGGATTTALVATPINAPLKPAALAGGTTGVTHTVTKALNA